MGASKVHRKDAGLRSLDHYKQHLPAWRLAIRDLVIPFVRWETPYIASIQQKYRTPALDLYFAITANLGTHTFYMVMLPLLFWCGYLELGRAMINMLASGVFFTGVLKDLFCLPRPLSPPTQRISQSATAPLEYGFPSTHSTNAFSVAAYSIYFLLQYDELSMLNIATQALMVVFTVSILAGRIYCGMHGFFDVGVGSLLGLVLAAVQCLYGDIFDVWIWDGPFQNVFITALLLVVLVRVHPEPADDCPCFDDSVAFAGVVIGIQLGTWHYAQSGFASDDPVPGTVPFSFQELGLVKILIRIFGGVAVVLLWRAIMKPTLLKILPPLFRVIERLGLSLPRKYFLNASEYRSVPRLRKDDAVIPPASEIPSLLNSLRHPRRRAVSIGPQSEADAYEAMAVREGKRRESRSSRDRTLQSRHSADETSPASAQRAFTYSNASNLRQRPPGILVSPVEDADNSAIMMTPTDGSQTIEFPPLANSNIDESDDQALFAKLQIPRVRYDVEVVTKLIVYAGIGWIAVEGGPLLFELCGLGLS